MGEFATKSIKHVVQEPVQHLSCLPLHIIRTDISSCIETHKHIQITVLTSDFNFLFSEFLDSKINTLILIL